MNWASAMNVNTSSHSCRGGNEPSTILLLRFRFRQHWIGVVRQCLISEQIIQNRKYEKYLCHPAIVFQNVINKLTSPWRVVFTYITIIIKWRTNKSSYEGITNQESRRLNWNNVNSWKLSPLTTGGQWWCDTTLKSIERVRKQVWGEEASLGGQVQTKAMKTVAQYLSDVFVQ